MDFKLIWSESSIEDLGAIVRFIALRDGPQIAGQIGFGIYERAQVLTRHPEAGTVLSEKQDSRWRKLIFKSWKIAYRIDREAKACAVVWRLPLQHFPDGRVHPTVHPEPPCKLLRRMLICQGVHPSMDTWSLCLHGS